MLPLCVDLICATAPFTSRRKRPGDEPGDSPASKSAPLNEGVPREGADSIRADEWPSDQWGRAVVGHRARSARQLVFRTKCVPHGLRKARMRRLAERGATTKEIASVSGHKTLKEVERYTVAADQARLARAAMAREEQNGTDECLT